MDFADLQRLSEIVQEEGSPELIVGDFAFDSLEDIRQSIKRDFIDTIHISSRSPGEHVTVHIDPHQASIYTSERSEHKGALAAVFLRKRVPWYSWAPPHSLWHFATGTVMVTLFLAMLGVSLLFEGWAPQVLFYSVLALVVFRSFSNKPLAGASRVYLTTQHERRSFWERNRDQIVVSLIIAIGAAIIGFILGRLQR